VNSSSPLRVAIIGAGHMGRIRAFSAVAHPDSELVEIGDVIESKARALAKEIGCAAAANWERTLTRADIDAVAIATPHKFLSQIAVAALRAGKYVFCEKPMACTAAEAEVVLRAVNAAPQGEATHTSYGGGSRLIVGYTLRHYLGIARAKEFVMSGIIGEPFCVRGRYGHGGRAGYEKEWRSNRELSGGGELMDQGVHLIDLSRWFLGEFRRVTGFVHNYFWTQREVQEHEPGPTALTVDPTGASQHNEEVEDNAFMLLKNPHGKTAMLHVSWTQWKNMFSFEVFGSKGSVTVEGLGGNYGPQRLVLATRQHSDGPPEVKEMSFDDPVEGNSSNTPNEKYVPSRNLSATPGSCWYEEWTSFLHAVRAHQSGCGNDRHNSSANVADGWENLRIVDAIYRSARENAVIDLAGARAANAGCSNQRSAETTSSPSHNAFR
jgi:predicted dehydrogenase